MDQPPPAADQPHPGRPRHPDPDAAPVNLDRDAGPIFVTGATGYIGGRLVPRLLDAGWRVRCLARSPRKLDSRPWRSRPGVEVIAGDVGDAEQLAEQMHGCQAAFYLVHSMMASPEKFRARDRRLATSFARAAAAAGVRRIVYLGGLGETGPDLSEHLASRREVEWVLADGPVPVTVLRAAIILGSGSASFEILRYLTERLPVMITPRWLRTRCQPIGVRNVLAYLVQCLDVPETTGRTLDVGGPDVLTYHDLIRITAELRGLPRRLILPVPVLTPRLSSWWIHLVTPLEHEIAEPLAEGLKNEVVVRDDAAARLMPQRLLSTREAIARALARADANAVETSWSDAGPIPGDPDWAGGTCFEDRRETVVDADPPTVFRAIARIGGGNGWYAADFLWRLRGALDQVIGGPGLRRGRRDPERVRFGDALDFWRVTGLVENRRLSLRAEMKVPGEALLRFDVEPLADGRSRLVQTALFLPKGLFGLLYWYAVLPLHGFVFSGMLDGIERTAEAFARGEDPDPGPERRWRGPLVAAGALVLAMLLARRRGT